MAVITSGLTVTMSTYLSKVFLEKARLLIRHDAFAQKRGVPAGQGKVVNFTRHIQPAVATTGLTESVTPTAVNVSGQQIAVTLVEYGAYEQISKFYERTSIDVGLKEQVEAMGINMGIDLPPSAKKQIEEPYIINLEHLRTRLTQWVRSIMNLLPSNLVYDNQQQATTTN